MPAEGVRDAGGEAFSRSTKSTAAECYTRLTTWNLKMSRRSVRRLCSESLETREVLAGNVNVVLSGNNLTITGDESANTIAITQTTATKTVRVEGQFTNIFLNGGGSAAFGGDDTTTVDGACHLMSA